MQNYPSQNTNQTATPSDERSEGAPRNREFESRGIVFEKPGRMQTSNLPDFNPRAAEVKMVTGADNLRTGIDTIPAWSGREMNAGFWHAAFIIVAVMLPTFTIGCARAHDHERPELNKWYGSLRSSKGPCCDGSDAKRVDDAEWEIKDGYYRVRIDGEWVDVPNEAVVGGLNRAGHTMVWPYYEDDHPKARCFMPGSHGLMLVWADDCSLETVRRCRASVSVVAEAPTGNVPQ